MKIKTYSLFILLMFLGALNLSAQIRTRAERLREADTRVTTETERREQAAAKLKNSNTPENSDAFLKADANLTRARRAVERLTRRR